MSHDKNPSNDHPAWKIVKEETNHNEENSPKMDVALDLKSDSHPWAKIGVTTGAALLVIGAFIFAPWSNPLQNFMGDITEETAFEDLFGNESPSDDIVGSNTDNETSKINDSAEQADALAELFGETPPLDTTVEEETTSELDALAELFGETPPSDLETNNNLDNFPTEPEIISEPTPVTIDPILEPAPITNPNFTNNTVPVALESEDEDLAVLTPEALPSVTPIVTPEPPTNQLPPTIGQEPVIETPIITTQENNQTNTSTQPNLITTNQNTPANQQQTPFPVNIHTVDRVAQNTQNVEDLRSSAPEYYNQQANAYQQPTTQQYQYTQPPQYVAESGPEEMILALLFIICSFVSWFITRQKKAA